MNKTFIDFR